MPAFGRLAYWFSLSQHFFAPAALALALTPVILKDMRDYVIDKYDF